MHQSGIKKMVTIGIDPGIRGAVAVFENGSLINVLDLPVVPEKGKLKIDAAALGALLHRLKPAKATLERVGAMPGQGVTSMFNFGRTVGVIEGVLGALAIPVDLVPASLWKPALRVPVDKHSARHRASQLMPAGVHWWPLAKHDGRAEAALIGLWALSTSQLDAGWIVW